MWSAALLLGAAAALLLGLAAAWLLGAAAAWLLNAGMPRPRAAAPKRTRRPPGFQELVRREETLGARPDGSVADTAIEMVDGNNIRTSTSSEIKK